MAIDTSNWVHGLPDKVITRLDLMAQMALSYPSACGEIYKIDRAAKQVRIVQRTHHRWQRNEWDIPKLEYGVMPPLMAFAEDEGVLVSRFWQIPMYLQQVFSSIFRRRRDLARWRLYWGVRH